ncbi:MAG TPA: ABC transporter permease [Vicinamibacterales bacterium]|nr:ABC transporter permease [Vicinamibacterales bacterium]
MTTFLCDVRHSLRTLRQHPGYVAVVVLTLGFGIGINTATFSIVNAVLIRPLEFAQPDRLVALHESLPDFPDGPFSPPDLLDFERDQMAFERVGAYLNIPAELSGSGEPVRLDGAKISATLLPVLGVAPLLGRGFTPEEDRPGIDVAILSWGLWQTRFAGDPSIVGRTITLDRRPYAVVGVMPSTFSFPPRGPQFNNKPASVWIPMAFTDRQRQSRGNEFNHGVIGRLKDGVSIAHARAELDVLSERINANYSTALRNVNFSTRLTAAPLRDEVAGRTERPLLLLLISVGLVLLVTCANVANLVLSRAASRSREIAVRIALGSSRGRLLQLLLAEAFVLSIAGALLGLLASRLMIGLIPASVADALPVVQEISIDFRVLAFSAALAISTSIVFALIPLITVGRAAPGSTLQEEATRTTPGVRRHRVQAGLVVSTVMLAFVLLIGAGLLIRSFSALMETDAGFNPDGVLTASLVLPRSGYRTAASVRSFHESLLTRAASLTGVRAAALMTDLPLERYERRSLSAEGVNAVSGGVPPSTNLSWVYGPYFQTLGIRVMSGRAFSDVENVEPRGVVVINEKLARTFWPGQDAIGKRLRWGANVPQNRNPWLTVVGVIADVADGPLGVEPFVHAYEPFSQFPDFLLNNIPNEFGRHVKLAMRTGGDPRALASTVRSAINAIDPQLAIESIATMNDRLGDLVAPRRFSAMTLGAFATGSLLLAAIGLYGLLAFSVAERRREIVVRIALGAAPPAIVRMVVGQGLKLVSIGLAAGIVVSYLAARLVASLLYQTESHDVITFGSVPLVLMLIALVACALPAWRASRVEPISAMRSD